MKVRGGLVAVLSASLGLIAAARMLALRLITPLDAICIAVAEVVVRGGAAMLAGCVIEGVLLGLGLAMAYDVSGRMKGRVRLAVRIGAVLVALGSQVVGLRRWGL